MVKTVVNDLPTGGLKGGFKGVESTSRELSKNQQEIYDLYVTKNTPISVIAKSRQISVQAVYKTLNKISVVKHLPTGGLNRSRHSLSTPCDKNIHNRKKYFRLHGCEFNIKILYKGAFYDKRRFQKGDLYYLDGNTIRLYTNSLEVYQNKEKFFIGDTIEQVNTQAQEYFTLLFHRIERSLGLILIKGENTSITMSKTGEYAEVNNEIAQEYNEKKQKVIIKASEDNKIWFVIDHSWNLNEAEFKHPKTSKQDAEKIIKILNQYRDNENLKTPIELQQMIEQMLEVQYNDTQLIQRTILLVETLAKKIDQII